MVDVINNQFDGDEEEGMKLYQLAVNQLDVLKQQMKFNNLPTGSRYLVFPSGVIFDISSCFGVHNINIFVPPGVTIEEKKKLIAEEIEKRSDALVFYRKTDSGTEHIYMAWISMTSKSASITKSGLASNYNWTFSGLSASASGWELGTMQYSFTHQGNLLYFIGGNTILTSNDFPSGGHYITYGNYKQIQLYNPKNLKWFTITETSTRRFTINGSALNIGVACFSDAIYILLVNGTSITPTSHIWIEKYTCDGDTLTLASSSPLFGPNYLARVNAIYPNASTIANTNILPDGRILTTWVTYGASTVEKHWASVYDPATDTFNNAIYQIYSLDANSGNRYYEYWEVTFDASGYPNGTIHTKSYSEVVIVNGLERTTVDYINQITWIERLTGSYPYTITHFGMLMVLFPALLIGVLNSNWPKENGFGWYKETASGSTINITSGTKYEIFSNPPSFISSSPGGFADVAKSRTLSVYILYTSSVSSIIAYLDGKRVEAAIVDTLGITSSANILGMLFDIPVPT